MTNVEIYLEDAPSQLHPGILSESFFHPVPHTLLQAILLTEI